MDRLGMLKYDRRRASVRACLAVLLGVLSTSCYCDPPQDPCMPRCGSTEACISPIGSCFEDPSKPPSCVPTGGVCATIYAPVCGCDGQTYGNACTATAAGASIAFEGECTAMDGGLTDGGLTDGGLGDGGPTDGGGACAPMDVTGEGLCTLVLGAAFDGASCVYVSGCTCVGLDCGGLFADLAGCESTYASCLPPDCIPMNARAVGPCLNELGVIFDGNACVSISGCNCTGSDCAALYPDLATCQAARQGC